MVKYAKRSKYAKKPYRKRSIKRRISKRRSLVSLIKRVSLKNSETKHTHQILENNQLYHNVPFMLVYNMLSCDEGVSDPNSGLTNFVGRIGNEVIARGISIKLWIANKRDRPNVMYRIIVYKYTQLSGSGITAPPHPYLSQGSSNYMIRDLDADKFKIVKSYRFNLQNNVAFSDPAHTRETHKYISLYIPLKNRRVKYEETYDMALGWNYAISIVAYDSYGTLTTDNIASIAYNQKFYFKDP
jgi:hypothetical protein